MSELKPASPGLFFSSLLYRSDLMTREEVKVMCLQEHDELLTFDHSFCPMMSYYEKEMGEPLSRFWLIGSKPQERTDLIPLKKSVTAREDKLARAGKRVLNWDVGLITLEHMVLATGKSYAHRLFLGDGVYGDMTYIFEKSSFKMLPWSYPDYAHEEVIRVFNVARNFLKEQTSYQ